MNQHPQNQKKFLRIKKLSTVFTVITLIVSGVFTLPANAQDYPSWEDVQNAKTNEAAAAKAIEQIQGLISALETEAEAARGVAEKKGQLLLESQQRLDEANLKVSQLENEATAAQEKAVASSEQAGKIAAQFYRTGGANLTAQLLIGGGQKDPEMLLSSLGSMSKVIEQSQRIYEEAIAAKTNSEALAQQATEAKTEREGIRAEADAAMQVAAAAVQESVNKLDEQAQQATVLDAQLAALKDNTVQTVADYEKGVAARAAAAAAARAAASANSGSWWGSNAGLPGGYVGQQGWAVPAAGRITDGFGPRISPGGVGSTYHQGIDIGAGCGSPIYAAYSGVVKYAGPMGSYGNLVLLDNGNGINTGYAHIVYGGVLVRPGQEVAAGEVIARVGTTGASTGCHLHYEVRISDRKINGIPFMAERGAPLG